MAGVSYPERNRYSHQDFGNKRTGLSPGRLCTVQHTGSNSCQWKNCKPVGGHIVGQKNFPDDRQKEKVLMTASSGVCPISLLNNTCFPKSLSLSYLLIRTRLGGPSIISLRIQG